MADCSRLFLLCLIFIMHSCKESNEIVRIVKYPNGNTEAEQIRLGNDASRSKIIYYYENGQKEREYFVVNDSIWHGLYKSYFPNGNVERVGNYRNNIKEGYHKYYDSIGNLVKVISFIKHYDTSVGRPNQIYYYDKNQQLITESPSFFCQLKNDKDTINLGEELMISIQLFGARFPNTYLKVCSYSEDYKLIPPMSCDTLHIATNRKSRIGKGGFERGVNIIRGAIVNYRNLENDNVEKMQIYFSDTVFVK